MTTNSSSASSTSWTLLFRFRTTMLLLLVWSLMIVGIQAIEVEVGAEVGAEIVGSGASPPREVEVGIGFKGAVGTAEPRSSISISIPIATPTSSGVGALVIQPTSTSNLSVPDRDMVLKVAGEQQLEGDGKEGKEGGDDKVKEEVRAQQYNQCGGSEFEGPTQCIDGYYCRILHPHYHQCWPQTIVSALVTPTLPQRQQYQYQMTLPPGPFPEPTPIDDLPPRTPSPSNTRPPSSYTMTS